MDSYAIMMQKLHGLLQDLSMLSERSLLYKTSCGCWSKCIDLLKPLSEELRASNAMPSNGEGIFDSFYQLESIFLKMKELLETCAGKESKLLPILQKQQILKTFGDLSLGLQSCLRLLPLKTFQVSDQIQEQVEQCASHLETTTFCMDALEESFFKHIESILMEIKTGAKLSHNMLVNIAGELDLKSNQEILREASFLEKGKGKAHLRKEKGEEDLINLLIILVTQMADDLAEQKQLQECARGVSIPADFRCPLSLELMSDPVIVASGQTYERTYIQQWLDQGNTTCPKSRKPLSHVNLIPNYIVKAFIVTWSESNGVSLPDPEKPHTISQQLLQLTNDRINHIVNAEPSPVALRLNGGNSIESSSYHQNVHTIEDGDSNSINVADSNMHPHVFHSRNASDSSHGSCLDDSFAALSLPNDSSSDVSLVSSSLAACADEYRSAATSSHHASAVSRRVSNHFSAMQRNGQSETDLAGDDGDNSQQWVQALVEDLQSLSTSTQGNAVRELRLLSKLNMENRNVIANYGAIPGLVALLHSEDPEIQENAVTTLLNLSLDDNNKSEIAAANAITPLIHVLTVGTSAAKENAAGTLISLSVMDENKVAIGQSDAIEPLVDLLINGTLRGKKDAATALYNLSLNHENKLKIVEGNAVRPLIRLMTDPAAGMVDKAVSVVQNLAYIPLGRESIGDEGGIPALVEVVETGSQRGKENAAAALFRLCSHSSRFRASVLQEGAIPPLVALTRSGTARAKEKATGLLRLFREQRQGRPGPDDRHRH